MEKGKERWLMARCALVACVVVSTATCGGPEPDESETGAVDEMPGTPSEREPGMDMAGGDQMQMMQRMRTHMQHMSGVPADSLMEVMPMHRQMVGQMLQGMDPATMRMGAQPDSMWIATRDSVRSDLTRMEGMSAEELREVMPAHRARVERLMSMHDSVMRMR
jgi:hypothetical protein